MEPEPELAPTFWKKISGTKLFLKVNHNHWHNFWNAFINIKNKRSHLKALIIPWIPISMFTKATTHSYTYLLDVRRAWMQSTSFVKYRDAHEWPQSLTILIQGNYLAPTSTRPSLHNVLNSCVNLVWCVRWPLISRPVISESAIFQMHTLNTGNMRNMPGEIRCSLIHHAGIIKPGKCLHGVWLPAWHEVIDVNAIMQKAWLFEDFWRPAFRLFSTRVSD